VNGSTSQTGLGARLIALTAAKATSNVALRWVGAFLPTLERAFGTTTGTLTSIIGTAELAGLSTAAAGRSLDRGRHRLIFAGGLLLVTASSVVALGGSIVTFALAMVLLVTGVSNLTVSGLAYIGDNVPYARRGRAIGVYEMSWAISLLVGAPILAWLIDRFGWQAAYVALAVITTIGALLILGTLEAPRPATRHNSEARSEPRLLPRSAWSPIIASAAMAAAGISVFVVVGAWMEDAHGMSVGGLGAVATAMGAVELVSSSSVALVSDRLGVARSVAGGGVLLGIGLGVVVSAGGSTVAAVVGLLVLVAGFEYGFVSSLSLVSEAAPSARGTALAIGNAAGTLSRATAVILSGQLYERFGIGGTAGFSLVAVTIALIALITGRLPGLLAARRAQ
jgi:DHA1 family inner membrane transport protein